MDWHCTSAVKYIGHAALQREIDTTARGARRRAARGCVSHINSAGQPRAGPRESLLQNAGGIVFALADAMSVEYKAIANAGFLVQVDDAWLAALWDRIGVKMGLEAYKRYCAMRVEALNHALKGIPPEQVRYHLCWGSWHAGHTLMIFQWPRSFRRCYRSMPRRIYSPAANVRHEHEYVVWKSVKLPDDKILAPGVVSHATTLIEHPDLVAERIMRFRAHRGSGASDRFDGLRPRLALPSADRMGEAAVAVSGSRYREQGSLGEVTRARERRCRSRGVRPYCARNTRQKCGRLLKP